MTGAVLKRTLERAMSWSLTPVLTRRQGGRILVLAYHNIVPEGGAAGGDASLHLPRERFAAQLDALRETHRVVSLDRALDLLMAGAPAASSPVAVVTFDDAYRGAMTAGLDELAERGLPATVFVSPGALGAEGFWWDQLASGDAGSSRGGSAPEVPSREELLVACAGRGGTIRERASRRGWSMARPPAHARPVTEEELREGAGRRGVTFGSHGWSHANLAELGRERRAEELERSLRWLESEMGDAALPVLSYPYGRCSRATVEAARRTGYRAAFRIEGGICPPRGADPHRLPRTNVPAGVSLDGFRLRTLGVLE